MARLPPRSTRPTTLCPSHKLLRSTSASTASWGGPAVYAYCTNYLIDVEHAVIVDVERSTAVRQAEVTAARTMLDRTHDRFDLWPERLIADTGYRSEEHTSELQSLMRISYAVFCLKKQKNHNH